MQMHLLFLQQSTTKTNTVQNIHTDPNTPQLGPLKHYLSENMHRQKMQISLVWVREQSHSKDLFLLAIHTLLMRGNHYGQFAASSLSILFCFYMNTFSTTTAPAVTSKPIMFGWVNIIFRNQPLLQKRLANSDETCLSKFQFTSYESISSYFLTVHTLVPAVHLSLPLLYMITKHLPLPLSSPLPPCHPPSPFLSLQQSQGYFYPECHCSARAHSSPALAPALGCTLLQHTHTRTDTRFTSMQNGGGLCSRRLTRRR